MLEKTCKQCQFLPPPLNPYTLPSNDQIRNVMQFTASANRTFNGTSSTVAYVTVSDLFGSRTPSFSATVKSALPAYASAIAAANNNATATPDVLAFLTTQHRMLFDDGVSAMELRHNTNGRNLSCEFWGTMPFARGSVHIASSDAAALQVAAARFLRRLYLSTSPLSELVAAEGYPGMEAVGEDASDEEWEAWLKRNMRSAYHGISTAAMLPREKGGVTGPACGVHGTANVRVVDASVVPFQTNGHTSSTVYAVAERCAELIRGEWGVRR